MKANIKIDHEKNFRDQKPLPKKQILGLKAGAVLEIKWLDCANTVGILLEKPLNKSGVLDLHLLMNDRRFVRCIGSDQVVAVLGDVIPMLAQPQAESVSGSTGG